MPACPWNAFHTCSCGSVYLRQVSIVNVLCLVNNVDTCQIRNVSCRNVSSYLWVGSVYTLYIACGEQQVDLSNGSAKTEQGSRGQASNSAWQL